MKVIISKKFAQTETKISLKNIPVAAHRRINNKLYELGKRYWKTIPLNDIFGILEVEGITPLQEDITKYQGMLVGGAECGSEEAKKQNATIDLGRMQNGQMLKLENTKLFIAWCKMPSGNFEINPYLT